MSMGPLTGARCCPSPPVSGCAPRWPSCCARTDRDRRGSGGVRHLGDFSTVLAGAIGFGSRLLSLIYAIDIVTPQLAAVLER